MIGFACFLFFPPVFSRLVQENLSQALKEFKRDKINRQNARLSLVNSLYENPSMPRRKILLSVGANNYRPPMERSKSAPKLMAIEEAVGEEEEISSQPSFKKSQSHSPYCTTDLFTSATFDRKYCKRNKMSRELSLARFHAQTDSNSKSPRCTELAANKSGMDKEGPTHHYDDDDDFHDLLMTNDYDMKSSLSGEILSYFDTKLSKSSSMLDQPEITLHPLALDTIEHLSDEHQNDSIDTANGPFDFDSYNSTDSFCSLENGHTVFNQNDVLNHLVATESKDSDGDTDKSTESNSHSENSSKGIPNDTNFVHSNGNTMVPFLMDSDEGSITSGCETSSIVTTAHMEDLMKSEREIDAITLSLSRIPPKQTVSNLERVSESESSTNQSLDTGSTMRNTNEEDSEFSDESGFDENNVSKTNHFRQNRTNSINIESTSNADANNNIKHTFNSNATKSVGRLRINIPKNAKSIDI